MSFRPSGSAHRSMALAVPFQRAPECSRPADGGWYVEVCFCKRNLQSRRTASGQTLLSADPWPRYQIGTRRCGDRLWDIQSTIPALKAGGRGTQVGNSVRSAR
jgi:hypothetical protein